MIGPSPTLQKGYIMLFKVIADDTEKIIELDIHANDEEQAFNCMLELLPDDHEYMIKVKKEV